MQLRKAEILSLLIVIGSVLLGWYFYPQLPEHVASHWNAQGVVDGYMGRFWGTFLLPVIVAIMWCLFVLIPRIEPKKENLKKFRHHFDGAVVLIMLFMVYLYLLTVAWNTGHMIQILRWLAPAFGILFFGLGSLLRNAEMNYTIGIRTPWTLASAAVWKKTHKLGAQLFRITGGLCFLGIVFPKNAVWFILVPILCAASIPMIASYFWYRAEKR